MAASSSWYCFICAASLVSICGAALPSPKVAAQHPPTQAVVSNYEEYGVGKRVGSSSSRQIRVNGIQGYSQRSLMSPSVGTVKASFGHAPSLQPQQGQLRYNKDEIASPIPHGQGSRSGKTRGPKTQMFGHAITNRVSSQLQKSSRSPPKAFALPEDPLVASPSRLTHRIGGFSTLMRNSRSRSNYLNEVDDGGYDYASNSHGGGGGGWGAGEQQQQYYDETLEEPQPKAERRKKKKTTKGAEEEKESLPKRLYKKTKEAIVSTTKAVLGAPKYIFTRYKDAYNRIGKGKRRNSLQDPHEATTTAYGDVELVDDVGGDGWGRGGYARAAPDVIDEYGPTYEGEQSSGGWGRAGRIRKRMKHRQQRMSWG